MNTVSNHTISCKYHHSCSLLKETADSYQLLFSRFSHEIRNPLTLINSSLPFIEQDCPAVLESPLWLQLKQDIASVLQLLKDMSSLKSSDSLALSEFTVKDFLEDLRTSFSSLMNEKKIRLVVILPPDLSSFVLTADRLKLKEAVTNLILNAVHALTEPVNTLSASAPLPATLKDRPPAASTSAQLTISAGIEDGLLALHIRDNGPGIPEEYLPGLFDPFVTHRKNGTGLGLYLAQNIAQLHGGSLSAETSTNEPDTFTDFCLQLPL